MINTANIKFLILFITLFSIPVVSFAGNENSKKEAEKSAMSWLTLVDNGDYGKSWDEAAILFQKAISKEDWVKTIKGVRPPLGEVEKRKFESATYMTEVPGAPDGEYVVIQYFTVFSNKASAIETITPMKEKDGSWKVSGYYIK